MAVSMSTKNEPLTVQGRTVCSKKRLADSRLRTVKFEGREGEIVLTLQLFTKKVGETFTGKPIACSAAEHCPYNKTFPCLLQAKSITMNRKQRVTK